MATAKCYTQDGSERGTQELAGGLFDCEVNEAAVHQAVVAYLANKRQGTASTKERSDVRGGGRKPYRQKGTGRARMGTIRSPLQRGGGVVFGPHPRDFRQALNKKTKRIALRSALSSQAHDGSVLVVDDLEYSEPKTKRFAEFLGNIGAASEKVLFVIDKSQPALVKSIRNIPKVKVTLANMVNTYEVLWADKVVVTRGALKVMEEVFSS